MRASQAIRASADPPDPGQAGSLDAVTERLRLLKIWAGDPSYAVIKDRINKDWLSAGRPVSELARRSTVADCFRAGRRRVNVDLLIAVVEALHNDAGYVAQWRQALRVVLAETPAAAQVRVQDVLPECVAEFTGRGAELDLLRQVLRRDAAGGGTVVVSAIKGMAGVGKTQLAIRAGQLLAEEDPFDHVLFVDLRGFHPDPGQPPADPHAVLDAFLRLLGAAGQGIPHDRSARAERYREQLNGRRVLVVLDNAADLDQVKPLVADGPRCVTLITSRRSLPELRRATHISVDLFTPDGAREFLARATPGVPVGDDPDALARVAHRCGYLPLALGLVVGHIRAKPGWTYTDHAEWLDQRHRNNRLDTGVELALSLSYQHLPPGPQRLFRLLALHPGHDVDSYAAAAIADADLATAEGFLRHLADEHLLLSGVPGRFGFHDLVRAYAADRATDEDRPPAHSATLTRLYDYYLHTAATAMDILVPAELARRPRIAKPATPVPPLTDAAAARLWLDTERANLIAAAGHAVAGGHAGHTTRLAMTLFRYLDSAGHYGEAVTLHTYAGEAAHLTDDRAGAAHAMTNLGAAYLRQGRHQEASDHLRHALTLSREVGDQVSEARALNNLGASFERRGLYKEAGEHYERALPLFRALGDRPGEAHVQGNLGIIHLHRGDYENAADRARQALALFQELGYPLGEAGSLEHLGVIYQRSGRYELAAEHHERALRLFRALGNRSGAANTLGSLAQVHLKRGDYQRAADQQREALALFREIGNLNGQAEMLNGLGEALLGDGRPDEALTAHSAALALAERIGDRRDWAHAHDGLARVHDRAGDHDRARHHWQHALTRYLELDVPEAKQIQAALAALPDPAVDATAPQ